MFGGVRVSSMTDLGCCVLLTTMSTTLTACKTYDYSSKRSVKPVHNICPPALQILSVIRYLASVMTDRKSEVQSISVDVSVFIQRQVPAACVQTVRRLNVSVFT